MSTQCNHKGTYKEEREAQESESEGNVTVKVSCEHRTRDGRQSLNWEKSKKCTLLKFPEGI